MGTLQMSNYKIRNVHFRRVRAHGDQARLHIDTIPYRETWHLDLDRMDLRRRETGSNAIPSQYVILFSSFQGSHVTSSWGLFICNHCVGLNPGRNFVLTFILVFGAIYIPVYTGLLSGRMDLGLGWPWARPWRRAAVGRYARSVRSPFQVKHWKYAENYVLVIHRSGI